jgi:hypothetical protein
MALPNAAVSGSASQLFLAMEQLPKDIARTSMATLGCAKRSAMNAYSLFKREPARKSLPQSPVCSAAGSLVP